MTDFTKLLIALRDRVAALTGPDREVDDAIWVALCWADHWREIARGELHFTASLDAVDALRERVLPGSRADIELGPQRGTGWENHIHHQGAIYFGAHTASTALAYLLAVLNALIDREKPQRPLTSPDRNDKTDPAEVSARLWQLMDTAPRDGTLVLVTNGLWVYSARWEKRYSAMARGTVASWWVSGGSIEPSGVYDPSMAMRLEPTRWMPIEPLPMTPDP